MATGIDCARDREPASLLAMSAESSGPSSRGNMPPSTAEPSSTPTLDELLDAGEASPSPSGAGTLVAECLAIADPAHPRRVLVRLRSAEGKPSELWLPTLAGLRPRVGLKLLLCTPDNWPEPVVIGVLPGPPSAEATTTDAPALASAEASTAAVQASGPQLRLPREQQLHIHGPGGQPLLTVSTDEAGAKVELFPDNVAIELSGELRLAADRIELEAREGDVDIRAEGDARVRARTIRLN